MPNLILHALKIKNILMKFHYEEIFERNKFFSYGFYPVPVRIRARLRRCPPTSWPARRRGRTRPPPPPRPGAAPTCASGSPAALSPLFPSRRTRSFCT